MNTEIPADHENRSFPAPTGYPEEIVRPRPPVGTVTTTHDEGIAHEIDVVTSNPGRPAHSPSIIFNITRCCTERCAHCAVSAVYGNSVEKCAGLARQETEAGREVGVEHWKQFAEAVLRQAPGTKFDLSGGDCLALPWVRHDFIPWLVAKAGADKVAVTAPAASLDLWLREIQLSPDYPCPGSVHFTLDGHSAYSQQNLSLSNNIQELGMEVHAECPVTQGNIETDTITSLYRSAANAGVSEITLIRFFPVGRGARASKTQEPTPQQYMDALQTWKATETPHGPKVKVQCALKPFLSPANAGACKIGPSAWCVMPQGTILSCPWAYGNDGQPLHPDFVIGDIRHASVPELQRFSDISRAKAVADRGWPCPVINYAQNNPTVRAKRHAYAKRGTHHAKPT